MVIAVDLANLGFQMLLLIPFRISLDLQESVMQMISPTY